MFDDSYIMQKVGGYHFVLNYGRNQMNIKRLNEKTKALTLLYVEDNEALQKVNIEVFSEIFKEVIYAKNGYEGLMKYQESHIDLVITDINMPIMDGLEMIEKIQKIDAKQTVIVLSACGEQEYLKRLKKLDIATFLTKPVDTKNLFKEIDKYTKIKEMV